MAPDSVCLTGLPMGSVEMRHVKLLENLKLLHKCLLLHTGDT